ncbi:hypothetical protein GCM10010124_14560 [Pilimelia terevasa]|uniref:Peptidase S8/S53 domain-containing protein n=1 Tax=Pilimelia terevasa TaxID=53372 RepID=A0A8J3FG51_9ACTN|nr:S8 family serine peptidase [Pilimelia terevasa]GGK23127.1 hypothetical protein GCM10010124_14560 [Pilimelia terevasa]
MRRRTGLRRALALLAAGLLGAGGSAPAAALPPRGKQWHLAYLRVEEAHGISTGEGVVVALIDTGADSGHPDLTGQFLPGRDFTGGTDDRVRDDADPDGHGTAMAGLIAAHGRTAGGALGLAPGARILPIRTSTGRGRTSGIEEAVRWATAQGAAVISISSVGPAGIAEQQAVAEAVRAGVVVVAGVGNRPQSQAVGYPAGYPGVLAVAGVDRRGRHVPSSVTGPQVMLAAPAADITTTLPRTAGRYYTGDGGTSSATAIVAGAAALVRAEYPQLTGPQVVARLTGTADDRGAPGRDPEYGYGVLNLANALTADLPGQPTSPPTLAAAAPAAPSSRPWVVYLVALGVLAATAAVATVWYWRRLTARPSRAATGPGAR